MTPGFPFATFPLFSNPFTQLNSFIMGQKLRVVVKRKRRKAYLKRKKEAAKDAKK